MLDKGQPDIFIDGWILYRRIGKDECVRIDYILGCVSHQVAVGIAIGLIQIAAVRAIILRLAGSGEHPDGQTGGCRDPMSDVAAKRVPLLDHFLVSFKLFKSDRLPERTLSSAGSGRQALGVTFPDDLPKRQPALRNKAGVVILRP